MTCQLLVVQGTGMPGLPQSLSSLSHAKASIRTRVLSYNALDHLAGEQASSVGPIP